MNYDLAGIRQAIKNPPYSGAFTNDTKTMPVSTGKSYTIVDTASKEIRYTQQQFLDAHLYGLPLEQVQDLIKAEYPEVLI